MAKKKPATYGSKSSIKTSKYVKSGVLKSAKTGSYALADKVSPRAGSGHRASNRPVRGGISSNSGTIQKVVSKAAALEETETERLLTEIEAVSATIKARLERVNQLTEDTAEQLRETRRSLHDITGTVQ